MSSSDDFNSAYLTFAKAMIATCTIGVAAYVLISHRQYYYSYFFFHTFPHAYNPHAPRLRVAHPRQDQLYTIAEQWKWDRYQIATFPPTSMGPPTLYYQLTGSHHSSISH
jgi:hypothetical protein